jgi:hypothetical protein
MVARLGHITNPWPTVNNPGGPFLSTSNSPPSFPDSRKSRRDGGVDDHFALPPEDEMERLIDNYFSDVGSLFPNLHKPSFLDSYAQLKTSGPRSMRTIWLGILNMVFAMANMTIKRSRIDPDSWESDAQRYYGRATSLCDTAVLSGTSLEVGESVGLSLWESHSTVQN